MDDDIPPLTTVLGPLVGLITAGRQKCCTGVGWKRKGVVSLNEDTTRIAWRTKPIIHFFLLLLPIDIMVTALAVGLVLKETVELIQRVEAFTACIHRSVRGWACRIFGSERKLSEFFSDRVAGAGSVLTTDVIAKISLALFSTSRLVWQLLSQPWCQPRLQCLSRAKPFGTAWEATKVGTFWVFLSLLCPYFTKVGQYKSGDIWI